MILSGKHIDDYLIAHSTGEDEVLLQLNRETHLKVLNPRMLSGSLQGKLLEFLSRMLSPDCILEIGTFTAYSSICLARGLSETGILHTIDRNDELLSIQKKYIQMAGLENKIKLYTGDALRIIPLLNDSFDLVFIDADKKEYCDYYKLIIDKVRPGGFVLADNVLWDGKVADKNSESDEDTIAIKAFNDMIISDPLAEVVMLPVRDGISIIRKR
jgi:predicted O-methyltransferase YrrM